MHIKNSRLAGKMSKRLVLEEEARFRVELMDNFSNPSKFGAQLQASSECDISCFVHDILMNTEVGWDAYEKGAFEYDFVHVDKHIFECTFKAKRSGQ